MSNDKIIPLSDDQIKLNSVDWDSTEIKKQIAEGEVIVKSVLDGRKIDTSKLLITFDI